IGSIQDFFWKTTTTATSGGELVVGSRWPCSKIPSGAFVATSDPTCASRVRNSRRALFWVFLLDCTGRPDNSGNKRPLRSPRGIPWLPKAADLASKFHREPPWRRPTRLVPVGSEIPDVLCFGYFCWTVRVDPTTLGTNDHCGHLEGSLGYPRPPTLPQNSIGSLRGD
ncbi:hypothetical protein CRG98_042879, partial [Punica granatum]